MFDTGCASGRTKPGTAKRRPAVHLPALVLATALLPALILAACAGDGSDVDTTLVDSSAPPPIPPADSTPYVASDSTLAQWSTLVVQVNADSGAAFDTLIFPIRDFDVCGAQLSDNSFSRSGDALSGAIVWLSGLVQGKQNPINRRFEITHQECQLWPRVQTVSTGGTLNVRNMDNAVHIVKFTDVQTGQTLARITQTVRGQVVPVEFILDVPRVIAVECETHPFTKGWIHVFNHPYHATVGRTGTVVMDSIPTGSHELVVWHERLGEERRSLHFTSGGRDSVTVGLGG